MSRGLQMLCDLKGCPFELLVDQDLVTASAYLAAEEAGAKVEEVSEHPMEVDGCSVVILSWSLGLTVHTYPELGTAAVDVYTLDHLGDPGLAVEALISGLQARQFHVTKRRRLA